MLCGCAQLFGIDETTRNSAPASLTVQRASIGARIVYAPQDLSASKATYLVPDEADPAGLVRVDATEVEPGRWTAPITRAAPTLFDLPDFPKPVLRLFDFPQRQVSAQLAVLEHPNPQAAPMGATIAVNVTLDAPAAAGERYELFVLGPWASIALPAPAGGTVGPIAATFPYASMATITGRPLERVTADDGVAVLRYVGNELRGALRAQSFDQAGTDTISGTMSTVTIEPFSFDIDQADLMRRYSAARPLVGTPTMSWTLRAAPGAQLGNDNGPILASGGMPAAMATSVMSQAGNPFAPDWPSTLLWLTQATRTYTPPSVGLQVSLAAGMNQRAILAPGLAMKLPAGLPSKIAIGGTLLETDGAMISKPARAVEVTFSTDAEPSTLYQLQLFKLVPNTANTMLQLEQKVLAMGAAPRFVLPPDLFEGGALYTLRAAAIQGGFPGAAAGDLTQRELPIAVSFLDSGVFQVSQ
jgi:hypothetical protein